MAVRSLLKGQHFVSRPSLSKDITPGCFVCGGDEDMYNCINAFVGSKESGELIVAMFEKGARLYYRLLNPQWAKVVVGACEAHIGNLERLHTLTHKAGRSVTPEIIAQSRAYSGRALPEHRR